MKKVLCLALAFLFLFLLCGCDTFSQDDSLLTPPRPQGELSEVQKALETAAPDGMQLRYPTDGQYRSAIVRFDLDSDKQSEAVAFYMTENEGVTMMHVAVVYKRNDEWKVSRDLPVMASGIERVEFEDLNGDGRYEIIVGWSVYGSVDKQVAVYDFKEGTLSHLLLEKYSLFTLCDLDTNNKKELFLLCQNNADKTAAAHIYTYNEDGISELSGCHSDGTVSSYESIACGKLLGGRQAVFVESKKGASLLTEIFYLENGALLNPLCDTVTKQTSITARPVAVAAADINGDSVLDIPVNEVMAGYEDAEDAGKIYITRWCSFDGRQLQIVKNAVMNYDDGYYFEIPKNLDGKITVARNKEQKLRIVYLYDTRAKMRTDELFRIAVFPPSEWTAEKTDAGWIKLYSDDSKVFGAQISGYKGEGEITSSVLLEMFKVIGGVDN